MTSREHNEQASVALVCANGAIIPAPKGEKCTHPDELPDKLACHEGKDGCGSSGWVGRRVWCGHRAGGGAKRKGMAAHET